ncbi:hypothetical protein Bhyg_04415, partial [Pseudolycoriella hygida]
MALPNNSANSCNDDNDIQLQLNYPWITKKRYSLKPALKKGENYLSQMIRAIVDYKVNNEDNQINFVIKAQISKAAYENDLFLREISVFKYVIPLAEELLKRVGDDTKFSARCYEANCDEYYLIFEDLIPLGYKNAERKNGLNMDKFRSTLSLLAKWHATTAVLMQTHNHIMRPFDDMFTTAMYESLVKTIIKKTSQFLTECVTGYDELARKLNILSDEMFHQIKKADERIPSEFSCLSHCDLWSNNIMFNDFLPFPMNALLIDFQMVHSGSPVLDICYLIFSSSETSMRETEFDYLLHYYHDQLSSVLNKLEYINRIPTLDDLQNEMLRRGAYGVPLGILGTIGRYDNDKDGLDMLTSESEENEII